MPLPRSAYGGAWKTCKDDGSHWTDTTAHPAGQDGYVAVPLAHQAVDNTTVNVVAGVFTAKTVQELADDASLTTELSAFAKAVDAQGEIIHGEALKAALQAAGKRVVRVNAKINAATTRRDNAIADLPNA